MDKKLLIHIGSELAVATAISFYFYRQISELKAEIVELKRICSYLTSNLNTPVPTRFFEAYPTRRSPKHSSQRLRAQEIKIENVNEDPEESSNESSDETEEKLSPKQLDNMLSEEIKELDEEDTDDECDDDTCPVPT